MIALVTGAGGFLGGGIARSLLARGDSVRSLSRSDYPALRDSGVDLRLGDLGDSRAVAEAVKGCDIVFHVAAKAGIWGREQDFQRTNVLGTANVIDACRQHQVKKLVFTSTPSVVFNGKDMENVDESVPYAGHYLADYPRTKAEAERLALAANGKTLATVALRPHLIWGVGDNHLIPRILAKARAGQLRRVGPGHNLVDCVYVDDAVNAHLLAADQLDQGSPIAGRAYFISGGEPVSLWNLIDRILKAAELPPVRKTISPRLAYAVGSLLETIHRLTGNEDEPRMTRFLAQELSTAHWFDITAARRDLGYDPRVSVEEGLRRLKNEFMQT